MGIMRVTSSTGNPTAVKTIAMVTRPADGIPAAPMAAAVDVKLGKNIRVILCYLQKQDQYIHLSEYLKNAIIKEVMRRIL